jgi:hypothetical protein
VLAIGRIDETVLPALTEFFKTGSGFAFRGDRIPKGRKPFSV